MGSSLERLGDWVAPHLRGRATPDHHRPLVPRKVVAVWCQERRTSVFSEMGDGTCLQKMFQKMSV